VNTMLITRVQCHPLCAWLLPSGAYGNQPHSVFCEKRYPPGNLPTWWYIK
jgi:hypothetical protein